MNRVLSSILVTTVAVGLSACVVDASGRNVQATFERALTVNGPVTLEVETGSGEVTVSTAEGTTVRIQGRVSASTRFFDGGNAEDRVEAVRRDPPIEQTGNDIHVGRWPRQDNVRISYLVTVPATTNVRVRTGSGDVRLADLQGPVNVQTGSGWIRLGHIERDVRARTGSGDVELEQSEGSVNVSTGSGRVMVRALGENASEVSTGSGDVEVGRASGPLRVRTGSGSVEVTGAPKASWEVRAGSGDLRLRVPMDASFDVDLRSNSGDISAESVVASLRDDDRERDRERRRRELRGRVGAGGPLVSMTTGSGEIRIR